MPNLRDIRKRIRSVANTGKITRAMQLVAASRMKKAQDAAISARPYAAMLAEMLSAMPKGEVESSEGNPFLAARPLKTRGILLVSTDRGLVGGMNSNLFRVASAEKAKGNVKFVAVGRKAAQFLSRTGCDLIACCSVSDRVPYHEVRPVVEAIVQAYLSGEVDTIEVLFPRFINNLRQEPTLRQLAPVPSLEQFVAQFGVAKAGAKSVVADDREMAFEPSPQAIIDRIVELYIRREIYQMMLEAKASEQSARMVAMKTATDNAKELGRRLTLNYNKARQAAITQELVELSAASAASS